MSFMIGLGKSAKIIKKSPDLSVAESFLFWLIWLGMVTSMFIIFLKFVISDIKNVFKKVSKNLKEIIQRDKVGLVSEADSMLPTMMKTKDTYSKYFIVREISV